MQVQLVDFFWKLKRFTISEALSPSFFKMVLKVGRKETWKLLDWSPSSTMGHVVLDMLFNFLAQLFSTYARRMIQI